MMTGFQPCSHVSKLAIGWIVAAAAALLPHSAFAEYRLEPGDVLEISVVSLPELKQRTKIDMDGEISLPYLGQIKVAGLPLSELRAKIQQLLPTKAIRRKTADGREDVVVVDPGEIVVDVAEYRPVYLKGDVAKPGEQPYRPGLTIRQAVALAGGYDIMHYRMDNPFLQSADLRGEYETLWTELAKEQAHIWRLRLELGNADAAQSPRSPILPLAASKFAEVESEQLKTDEVDHQKEKAYLQRAIEQADAQLSLLAEERTRDKEEAQLQSADLERVKEAFQHGLAPISRLTEERRAMLQSSARLLQTTVQMAQVRREHQDLGRKLEQLDDKRRAALLHELQDANFKIASVNARLQAVGEKLLYAGTLKSQLVRGKGGTTEIALYRGSGKDRTRVPADEDTALLPGDVVEVVLGVEYLTGAPSTKSGQGTIEGSSSAGESGGLRLRPPDAAQSDHEIRSEMVPGRGKQGAAVAR